MDDLFGSGKLVASELQRLSSRLSPEVRVWALAALAEERLLQTLAALVRNNAIQASISLTETVAAGLEYIDGLIKINGQPEAVVTQLDITGSKPQSVRELEKIMDRKTGDPEAGVHWRVFGIVSHQVAPRIYSGAVFSDLVRRASEEQLPLFSEPEPFYGPLGLRPGDVKTESMSELYELVRERSIAGLVERAAEKWREIQEVTTGVSGGFNQFFALQSLLPEIVRLLTPFFGDALVKLWQSPKMLSRFYAGHTTLSWLASLLDAASQGARWILFTEIPPLPREVNFTSGRIDAVRVLSVGGREPSESERRYLCTLAADRKGIHYRSVGHLIQTLVSAFGEVELDFIDWKFTVGDGDKGMIILPNDPLPIAKHRLQMEGYLALTRLGTHLFIPRRDIWGGEMVLVGEGNVWHFFSSAEPVVKPIAPSFFEQLEWFIGRVVNRWEGARLRAMVRQVDNALVGQITRQSSRATVDFSFGSTQTRLFAEEEPRTIRARFDQVLASHRWLDGHQIATVTIDSSGRRRYFLHYGHLLDAIRTGRIGVSQNFDPVAGGHICCFMPDHQDDTPSLMVWPQEGLAKCFGQCGRFFEIIPSSIPAELGLEVSVDHRVGQQRRAVHDIVIPERYVAALEAEQQALQQGFWGSPAEKYLFRERRLDCDLAFAHGAGYARPEKVLSALWEFGLAYDELLAFGMLGLSVAVKPEAGIGPLLQRLFGLSAKDRRRPKQGKDGYPYFPLLNRVTWPLFFADKLTTLYGRNLTPSSLPHYKQKMKQEFAVEAGRRGIVPQGGFNMQSLVAAADHPVLITEAVIDGLTLIQMGYQAVIAVVGARNRLLVQPVVHGRSKVIYFAFDNDDTGRKSNLIVAEWLRELGFTGRAEDLTGAFFERHPLVDPKSGEACKDFNRWLQLVKPEEFQRLKEEGALVL